MTSLFKMAEAALENTDPNRNNKFYCHQCSIEIKPKLPDFTCPECDNGFIEEIAEETSSTSTPSSSTDPAQQFAELWGNVFLESFRSHTGERDEGVAWARDRESDDEDIGTTRRQHRAFQPPPRISRRTRPIRNQYLQGLFQYFSDRIDTEFGGGGAMGRGGSLGDLIGGGIPINIVPLHGNPDDYAWGSGGLDSIITQLLNQLEGSGAPPAQPEKIDSLPEVTITQPQVDNILQCSVCMEDFKVGENVNKLPCDHHYHNSCIVTWLKMHGTCPVCRKDLNGEDLSLKEGITPIVDDDSPEDSNSSNDMT